MFIHSFLISEPRILAITWPCFHVSITASLPLANLLVQNSNYQMTQGHNIVANGWAGASNPLPHPNPTPNHSCHELTHPHNKNCGIINARFLRFQLELDRPRELRVSN